MAKRKKIKKSHGLLGLSGTVEEHDAQAKRAVRERHEAEQKLQEDLFGDGDCTKALNRMLQAAQSGGEAISEGRYVDRRYFSDSELLDESNAKIHREMNVRLFSAVCPLPEARRFPRAQRK